MINKTNFLNAKQVSECLGIPLRTVQHLSKKGKIKAIKIGNNWKYFKNDIDKYLLSGTDFFREPARKPDSAIDRRIHPRINCSIPCAAKVSIPDEKEISFIGRISNISQGGVFVKNHGDDNLFSRIKNDDPINLKFELNGSTGLEVNGRVLRKQNNGAAVIFRNISEDTRKIIANYIG